MSRRPFFPSILTNVLPSVCRVFLANRKGDNRWIPLSPVAPEADSSPSMEDLVATVDRVLSLVVVNTSHQCLYSSSARCRILRRSGYPVQLNIGLHNLQGKRDAEGHCWLSLQGNALFEENDAHMIYTDRIGERDESGRGEEVFEGEEGVVFTASTCDKGKIAVK